MADVDAPKKEEFVPPGYCDENDPHLDSYGAKLAGIAKSLRK